MKTGRGVAGARCALGTSHLAVDATDQGEARSWNIPGLFSSLQRGLSRIGGGEDWDHRKRAHASSQVGRNQRQKLSKKAGNDFKRPTPSWLNTNVTSTGARCQPAAMEKNCLQTSSEYHYMKVLEFQDCGLTECCTVQTAAYFSAEGPVWWGWCWASTWMLWPM